MGRAIQKYSWRDHLFNISIVLFFILPQNELLYYFVPIAVLLLTDWNKSQKSHLKTLVWVMMGSLVITITVNAMSPWATSKSLFKLIELALLLICFGRLRCFVIIKEYLFFLVIYLITFQFAYQFNISFISQLLQQTYPLPSDELSKYAYIQDLGFSNIGVASARLGGIYYNSNNCASFLEMLLILLINERRKFKDWMFAILFAFIVLGIISTGSRTSLIVLAVLLIVMFGNGNIKDKIFIVLFLIAGFIFFLNYGSSSRMLMIREGMSNSFLIKVGILEDYVESSSSPLRLLFGCLSGTYLVQVLGEQFSGTDFDIGDVSVSYGFVFVFLLLLFLWYLFKNTGRYKNILIMLIWCFSNTIFMSYRASALFLLITSMYYSKNLVERKAKSYVTTIIVDDQ